MMHRSYTELCHSALVEIYLKVGSSTAMMESLWFLGVLAIALIACKYLIVFEKGQDRKIAQYMIPILIAVASILFTRLPLGVIPLRLTAIPGAMLFIYIGNRYGNNIVEYSRQLKILSILCMATLFIRVALLNMTVNISTPVYNDYFLFIIGAIFGIIITFWISNKVNSRMLEFLGRNSLILFAVHGIWLQGYSLILSYFMGQRIMFMENIPHLYATIGAIFVLLMSCITYFCIKDIYSWYFNTLKKIIKF